MAISMGGDGGETPMSDINTTPLVDVMLVLLIIFLIAIPVAIQTIENLELPVQEYEANETKAENVLLSVTSTDASGRSPGDSGYEGASQGGECRIYRNVTPVGSTELQEWATEYIEKFVEDRGGIDNIDPEDVPEAHIRGDIDVPYRCVGGAIFIMQASGFPKVGFISEPNLGA
ncbi:MAG: biopolymer transporter ExbD [Pseudomonadota bacterium]